VLVGSVGALVLEGFATGLVADPIVRGTYLKYWTGTGWGTGDLRRWNGVEWAPAVLKRWTGATWVVEK
jgi:hypothetical protein